MSAAYSDALTVCIAPSICSAAPALIGARGQYDAPNFHWPVAIDFARRELQKALIATEAQPDERSEDARAAMAWFNHLTPTQRLRRLSCAKSAVPADAWEAFKAGDAVP